MCCGIFQFSVIFNLKFFAHSQILTESFCAHKSCANFRINATQRDPFSLQQRILHCHKSTLDEISRIRVLFGWTAKIIATKMLKIRGFFWSAKISSAKISYAKISDKVCFQEALNNVFNFYFLSFCFVEIKDLCENMRCLEIQVNSYRKRYL